MKRILLVLAVVMALAVVVGYALPTALPGAGNGVTYMQLADDKLPPDVKAWAESARQGQQHAVTTIGGKTYVLIWAGPMPTAGYTVKVNRAESKDGQVVLHTEVRRPSGMAATVITYPTTVVELDSTVGKVDIQLTVHK